MAESSPGGTGLANHEFAHEPKCLFRLARPCRDYESLITIPSAKSAGLNSKGPTGLWDSGFFRDVLFCNPNNTSNEPLGMAVSARLRRMSHTYTANLLHVVFSTKHRRYLIPPELQPRLWG